MSVPGNDPFTLLWRLPGTAWRLARQGRLVNAIRYVLRRLFRHGLVTARWEFALRLAQSAAYKPWVLEHDSLSEQDFQRLRVKIEALVEPPLISLLMPTYNSPEQWLDAAVASVRQQIYPHWELCIADDASTAPHVRLMLERLSREDSRIRVHYRDINGHISAASNDALSLANGDFVGLIDHDDLLPAHALALVALTLAEHPDCDLIYSDEDKIDLSGERFGPYFKPDWNPDLLRSQNMVSHFGIFRRALVCKVGGFRTGFEGCQDWDLALRVSEESEASRIYHLPFVLYHWRTTPGSTSTGVSAKSYLVDAGRRAVQEHLGRVGIDAEVLLHRNGQFRISYALPSPPPTVSLLVELDGSAAAHALYLNLPGWRQSAGMPVFEIVVSSAVPTERMCLPSSFPQVVDAGLSPTPNGRRQRVADRARGDVLVFISPQLQAHDEGWLVELVSHAMRPATGAVGTRLLDSYGELVGGGYILGLHDRVGIHHGGIGSGDPGYMGRGELQQNLTAVSSDCFAIRRNCYHAVGGLNAADFPTCWADVDLCIRLRQEGFWNVWTPHVSLRYSKRPLGLPPAPVEDDGLRSRWPKWVAQDPAYNPNLSLAWSQPIVGAPRHALPWHEEVGQ